MKGRIVFKMKRTQGWLVRLIYCRKRYLVNAFSPRGKLHSKQFMVYSEAEKFFDGVCSYLNRRRKKISPK